jgi:hypothetical protein
MVQGLSTGNRLVVGNLLAVLLVNVLRIISSVIVPEFTARQALTDLGARLA